MYSNFCVYSHSNRFIQNRFWGALCTVIVFTYQHLPISPHFSFFHPFVIYVTQFHFCFIWFFVVICFGFYFFSFKIYWLFLIFICVSVMYTFPTLPKFGPFSLPVQLNFASFLFSLEDQLHSQNILRYNFWLRYGRLTRVF